MGRYNPISSEFYINNRKRLKAQLASNAVFVLHSNDVMPTNADGKMPFRQNNSLFYLTGIDQEASVLLIFWDTTTGSFKEILFLKYTSDEIATWEGQKLTLQEGTSYSGIQDVRWLKDYEEISSDVFQQLETIYVDFEDKAVEVETRNARLFKDLKLKFPNQQFKNLAPLVDRLRASKRSEEIEHLQKACDITEAGFREVLKTMKPGMREYEIEALYSYEFLRRGSRGFAYEPIVAGGKNACVLHYTKNDEVLISGDLVLMDVGAEYGNYNADLTRTLPVNGRFTARQRAVYEAVLKVKKEATQLLVIGNNLKDYQQEVGKIMESELIGLGLLNKKAVERQDLENPLYKTYFMHGTSHHLGLDVHDVPPRELPFEEGMVLTVEPGIYIKKEGIGIRLEDDMVITAGEPLNLMANIPLEVEEIESLMNES